MPPSMISISLRTSSGTTTIQSKSHASWCWGTISGTVRSEHFISLSLFDSRLPATVKQEVVDVMLNKEGLTEPWKQITLPESKLYQRQLLYHLQQKYHYTSLMSWVFRGTFSQLTHNNGIRWSCIEACHCIQWLHVAKDTAERGVSLWYRHSTFILRKTRDRGNSSFSLWSNTTNRSQPSQSNLVTMSVLAIHETAPSTEGLTLLIKDGHSESRMPASISNAVHKLKFSANIQSKWISTICHPKILTSGLKSGMWQFLNTRQNSTKADGFFFIGTLI